MDKHIETLKDRLGITSYHFNGQEYPDFGTFIEAGSTYLQSPDGQNWLSRNPEYHQELKMSFDSETATPKQKIEIMSEFGDVQVNGYDILAGLAYSDALSDDARYLSLSAISEIDNQLGLYQATVTQRENLRTEDQSSGINFLNHVNQNSVTVSPVVLKQDELYETLKVIAQEKAPDRSQEPSNTGGELLNRNSSFLGEESPGTAPQPVEQSAQPDFPANVHLHFTTDDGNMSNKSFRKNLRTLNLYSNTLRDSAQWYLSEMSGTTMSYVYKMVQREEIQILNVYFDKKNWMHLTGVTPVYDRWVESLSEQFIDDIARGHGHFKNLKFAPGTADKLKVLNLLPEIIESDTFVFNDLSSVEKFHNLDLSQALNPEDTDLLLLFKGEGEYQVPASLMRIKGEMVEQLSNIENGTVLAVYREKDGRLEQISINEEYVRDGGEELFSILKNKKYRAPSAEESPKREESYSPNETVKITPEAFTQVLDAVYNVGSPHDLSNVPEEFHGAWKHYFGLSEASKGDFKHVIDKAVQEGLVLTESSFYQEWSQDRIYNENYHVRIQQVDNWPDGESQPFNSGDLRAYEEFVTSLYKGNQVLGDSLTEATKITFDIYAPGGQLIKDKVSYDMGVETAPVSRLLGLGYRRLEGQSELAKIDEAILSQLENQKVNQEIATEANEPVVAYKEVPKENIPKQDPFTSPKQEMKAILDKQVEKIVAEDMANPVPQIEEAQQFQIEAEFDYKTASAYEISEMAFQKIREYTQSPEALAEYLEFMSKFPQLSPRNVALIQAQWPGANAVATYDQWQGMGEVLGIDSSDVIQTKKVYTNKRTGETQEVIHQGLSVKTGEKAQITLFRPLMTKMIPVLDAQGNQLKNDRGNPKYKKLSQATPQEKALVKEGKLQVKQFQERDLDTGVPRFTTYKVFELSQTTLKPESYPKAMPNRHFDFNTDQIKTTEVLEGLCDYAKTIGVTILQDDAHELGNIKGAFYPGRQLILLNSDNTPGEKIATTIHELAHATLHNPSLKDSYQAGLPKNQKELEAEMTSHLVSKHFGLDTSEKAFDYLAKWTKNLIALDDQQLTQSFKRIHKTVSQLVKHVEAHTKPYQVRKQRGMQPNFSQAPKKGPSR
ncbi:TPA: ImmA/IrrE family metallo-endopeptidase [Streptococcus suis]|nr:ImmA/IrrE family metallo-endopeptidase [Streptococcus suis]HEM3641188.1 ImmA/IrrE family metallo-endopeptidase [Streptococcus suis]